MAAKSGRAEEYDRVLNLFAAEARQRLHVLGEDAQNAPVRTVKEDSFSYARGADVSLLSLMMRLSFRQCWIPSWK